MSYVKWTNREIAQLKRDFPVMSRDELAIAFAPHPIQSIYTMAYASGARRKSRWHSICALHQPVIPALEKRTW